MALLVARPSGGRDARQAAAAPPHLHRAALPRSRSRCSGGGAAAIALVPREARAADRQHARMTVAVVLRAARR